MEMGLVSGYMMMQHTGVDRSADTGQEQPDTTEII